MLVFVPGQRWISEMETERGLGTILSSDRRTVTILYHLNGEVRTYTIENSPLTRIQFDVGDLVEHQEGWRMRVCEVIDNDGLLVYKGVRLTDQSQCELLESELSTHIELVKPLDRLLAGKLDSHSNYVLRYNTLQHYNEQQLFPYLGLSSARTRLLPHQLYIAHEVSSRFAPRVLLADEVGLGKTIEAGLIINQQLLTGQAERVLLLVPESLVHQWLVEMLRKFNLTFSIFDQKRCEQEKDGNPFEAKQCIISSIEFLSESQFYKNALLDNHWDLVVVDEAHHLKCSADGRHNARYDLVKQLSQKTEGLLLLTATPEQMGIESHFARLQLLDPNRFYDFDVFLQEQAQNKPVALAIEELINAGRLQDTTYQVLLPFLKPDEMQTLEEIQTASTRDDHRNQKFMLQLADRHTVSRVMFKNLRSHVPGFLGRGVQSYPLEFPELFEIAVNEMNRLGAVSDLTEQIKYHLNPELAYQRWITEENADPWWQVDPRVNWLLCILKLLKKEKVLVICEHAETALDIENALRIRSGVQTTAFHEGMSIVERDKAAAWFADIYGAQALICSKIGSEGRNFQFAHHLILFGLPFHPDLLEQQIGRLDRIGQEQPVRIHVPVFASTPQERLFNWYHQGLVGFTQNCPSACIVYEQLRDELIQYLLGTEGNEAALFLEKTAALVEKQNQLIHEGRDKVFELLSKEQSRGEAIANAIKQNDNPKALKRYVELLLQCFGIDIEDYSDNALLVKPGNHMTVESYPGLPSDGLVAMFNRDEALIREDTSFMSWAHPMVRDGMEMLLCGETGNTTVSMLLPKNVNKNNVKVGRILLEAIFVVSVSEDPKLQLNRFLPPTSIRVLFDDSMTNLTDKISFLSLQKKLSKVPNSVSKRFIKTKRAVIHKIAQVAEAVASKESKKIVERATEKLVVHISDAVQRLMQLKESNPNVRKEEILFLEKQLREGRVTLQNAVLKLDSIQLILIAQ